VLAKRKLRYGENVKDWAISSQDLNYLNKLNDMVAVQRLNGSGSN